MKQASGLATAAGGTSVVNVSHVLPGAFCDGFRSVLGVIATGFPGPITVTSIVEYGTAIDGGWTARGSYTAQDMTIYLFDKICGPAEVTQYTVTFSDPLSLKTVWLADFVTTGSALRTFGFADAASGTTLTLPSLTAANADDIWTFTGTRLAGDLTADSPLTGSLTGGGPHRTHEGSESYQSSAATGSRSHTASLPGGTFTKGIGVMMLVGEVTPPGGWGVGQVRMGAN